MTGVKTRSQIVIWSDTQLYGMQFLPGDSNVFGFTPLGTCKIVGPNALGIFSCLFLILVIGLA